MVVCLEEVWHVLSEDICQFPDGFVVIESADLIIKMGCMILVSVETDMGYNCINNMFDCFS